MRCDVYSGCYEDDDFAVRMVDMKENTVLNRENLNWKTRDSINK
jgi:hypothetical protein